MINHMRKIHTNDVLSCALLLLSVYASAQTSGPDLQGAIRPVQPSISKQLNLPGVTSGDGLPAPGGVQVTLKEVVISGNHHIDTSTLLVNLGHLEDRQFDMRGLMEIINAIGDQYRKAGYLFSQAYLPPQDLSTGQLKVQVIEGQYGLVQTTGEPSLAEPSQPFLEYGLHSGDPIENAQLERTMLIIDDLPGIKVKPLMKPSQIEGGSDLLVNVYDDESEESGNFGFDNTGSRSTGEHRLVGSIHLNNKIIFGDKFSLTAVVTDKRMWLGSLDYDVPVGYSGLRGDFSYAHTSYVLGGDFSSLGAHGIADTTSFQMYHPVVRSQLTNLYMSLSLHHKELQDVYANVDLTHNKRSNGLVAGLRFDHQDRFVGGGITYGSASLTQGELSLDSAMYLSDLSAAQTAGGFGKSNVDIARIQLLTEDFSLYGRFSGQWANKNLDASEKFNLGGYYGVRAYPMGEGTGDRGYLGQFELRYAVSQELTPFVFYDAGYSKLNARPWSVANSNATRAISGQGVGVRSVYDQWHIDMTLAAQGHGGAATSDSENRNPRFFFMVSRSF